MIITYPIELKYALGTDQRVLPAPMYSSSEKISGSFPMGKNKFWHGGVHLHPTNKATPIRAIADGELVAYRFDDVDVTDVFFEKKPYSRSFVLLKHETELGETTLGSNKLVFYSLYMHLQAWGAAKAKTGVLAVNFLRKFVPALAQRDENGKPVLDKHKNPVMVKAHIESIAPTTDGVCHSGAGYEKISRGDILGYCGSIPDDHASPSQGIHFEIFLADTNFLANSNKAIWGKCQLTEELSVKTELLTKLSITADPKKNLDLGKEQSENGYKVLIIEKKEFWVSDDQVAEKEIDVPDPKHKGSTIKKTQYNAVGNTLQGYKKDPVANQRKLAKGTHIIPWIDPWLKSDEYQEISHEGKNWVKVYTPDNNTLQWAEKTSLHYVSDADWKDFVALEESGAFSADGFIDDKGLLDLFATYDKDRKDNNTESLEKNEDKLRHLITKHPTEWSKSDILKRFNRVTLDIFGGDKLDAAGLDKLSKHINRLAFWEDVPGLPAAGGVWHPHPIKFIEQLAKCMWLSKDELGKIYPDELMAPVLGKRKDEATAIREKYRTAINRATYKYAIKNRLRLANFLGQSQLESAILTEMAELSGTSITHASRTSAHPEDADYYKNDPYFDRYNGMLGNTSAGDGCKFRGRGMKQLTGRSNYADYWTFRGWLIKGVDYDAGWWSKPDTMRAAPINDPQKLSVNPFDSADCSTWFWAFGNPSHKTMDPIADADNTEGISLLVNKYDRPSFPTRKANVDRIKKVFGI